MGRSFERANEAPFTAFVNHRRRTILKAAQPARQPPYNSFFEAARPGIKFIEVKLKHNRKHNHAA